jgi:hypothetical protein
MSSPNLGKPGVTEKSCGIFSTSGATFPDSGCAENPANLPILPLNGSSAAVTNNNTAVLPNAASFGSFADPTVAKPLTAHILMAIDGPSPNVGSGATAPYGIATTTEDGVSTGGTGTGLGPNGIAQTTYSDSTETTTPSSTTVPQLNQEVTGVHSGLAVPAGIPTTTAMGATVQGTGADQTTQNATTAAVVTNPNPTTYPAEPLDGSSPNVNSGKPATLSVGSVASQTDYTVGNPSAVLVPASGSSPNTASGLPAAVSAGSFSTSTGPESLGPA